MTVLGQSSKPTRAEWWGVNVDNQHHIPLTLPAGGPWKITRLGCWASGKDGTCVARLVLWNSSGAVLGQSAQQSWAGHPYDWSEGGWDNHEGNLETAVQVNGGTTVWAGWARDPSDPEQLGLYNAGGGHYDKDQPSWPGSQSGATYHTTYGKLSAYLYYEPANTAPGAPTNVKIDGYSSGSTIPKDGSNIYLLTASGNDPGDVMASYDYEIDTTTGNGVTPDWASPPFTGTDVTDGITGQSISSNRTHAFSPGQWYALRIRTTDDGGLTGAWSATYYFKVNQNPTVTGRSPGAAAFAFIHNLLTDLAVWTSAGSHAKPRFVFTYNDADGQASSQYIIRVYNDNAGVQGTLKSTETVNVSVASGTQITHNSTNTLVNGTQYWWTVEVKDSMGASSGEQTATRFKVRWGQAIYEYNAGAGSSAWAFSNAAVANGSGAFLFASATGTGGTGRGSWYSAIGQVPVAAYVNILVRLAPNVAGTNVTLPDMTFTYLGSATTPDQWTTAGSVGGVSLDPAIKRFGTQSLKYVTAAASSYLYPYRKTAGDDVYVTIGATYTFSAYVKIEGTLQTGVRLAIWKHDGTILTDDEGAEVASPLVTNTAAYPDGWQRLTLTFVVPSGQSILRPSLHYQGATAGQVFWVDGVKLEEGTVASPWVPGFVADAVVLDANGIAVDALAGGILRVRGSSGGARDVIDIGPHGWLFGGDTEISSPSAGKVSLQGSGQSNFEIKALSGQRANVNALVEGDTQARAVLFGDATLQGLEFGPGNAARDVSIYRGGADILRTDDIIQANAHTPTRVDRGGSGDTTDIPTAGSYTALTNGETATITPTFVGQRFEILVSGYCALSVAGQYGLVRADIVDSSNVQKAVVGYARINDDGTVAIAGAWTADAVAARKVKLYGTVQTTNGTDMTLNYTQITFRPMP